MRRKERGGALVYVVIIAALLSVALLSATTYWTYADRRHLVDQGEYQAEFLAQAGQEEARARLSYDPNYDRTRSAWTERVFDTDNTTVLGEYTVTITRPAPNLREVLSQGRAAFGQQRQRNINRTYEVRGSLPTMFSNGSMSLGTANVAGNIHANGDIYLVWTDTTNMQLTATGSITIENGLLSGLLGSLGLHLLGGSCQEGPGSFCDAHVPVRPVPTPDSNTVQARATQPPILLTSANTSGFGSNRTFHLGGGSDNLLGGTDAAHPYNLSADPLRDDVIYIYKNPSDPNNYTVEMDDLYYSGRGTIAIGPGVKFQFRPRTLVNALLGAKEAEIQRVGSESCIALIVFNNTAVNVQDVTFQGVLYAPNLSMSSNFSVTGSLIAGNQASWPASHQSFDLHPSPEMLRNVPAEIPGATELVIINES